MLDIQSIYPEAYDTVHESPTELRLLPCSSEQHVTWSASAGSETGVKLIGNMLLRSPTAGECSITASFLREPAAKVADLLA